MDIKSYITLGPGRCLDKISGVLKMILLKRVSLFGRLNTSWNYFNPLFLNFSAMNNMEYGEAPEYFLPASLEQKIKERAESVVRPGTLGP
jgi:hypothetical protein